MPKATKAGASNAWERAVEAVEHGVEELIGELRGEHTTASSGTEDVPRVNVVGEGGTEFLTFPAPEPVAAPVAAAPAKAAATPAPAPVVAPAPTQDTPVAPAKGGTA